jgi:pyruvate/2-oxoglutarate dehydrogenase complex dihydrolipoamide acyltransferase (E2) component
VLKVFVPGAVAAALLAGAANAAPVRSPLAWIITPGDGSCKTVIDLQTRGGAITPVQLTSDGAVVSLRFHRDELPERAFLPIRVDQKRFSNLMLRVGDGTAGELIISEETEAAMRKGTTLAVAWLGDEPLSGSLSGSGPGLSDLRTCGAQAAAQAHARLASETERRTRAEADARAKAVADAQVQAARAQAAAAEAERRRVAEVAERQKQQEAAEQERVYAEQRQRAYDAERQRTYGYVDDREAAYEAAQQAWRDQQYRDQQYREQQYRDQYEDPRWYPPRPAYPVWGRRY